MIPVVDLGMPVLQWARIPEMLYAVRRDGRLVPRYPDGQVPDFWIGPSIHGPWTPYIVHWAWVPDGVTWVPDPNSCLGWSARKRPNGSHNYPYWTRQSGTPNPSIHDEARHMAKYLLGADELLQRMALSWSPA